ncbi:MAG: radical SAM protein [Clostridium sp.]|nr:radical SAM protein [Clostridium sp.]
MYYADKQHVVGGGKIKRFIELLIPIHACTLRCPYCYVTHRSLFDNTVEPFKYKPKEIRKALSVKRLGGVSLINMCATGETLLSHEVVEIAKELLEEGHYVMIVTNATLSNRIEEITSFPKPLLNRLFFKFSYHYEQLKKRNLLDKFFLNIRRVKESGASFTLEVTPYDELIPIVDELNQRAIDELGAIPHYTVARDDRKIGRLPLLTKMGREEYRKAWGQFNSPLFDFKFSIFEHKRKEFCYAGDWSGVVDLQTGTWRQCYYNATRPVDIFSDIEKPIPFQAIGHNCMSHHCWNGHVWLGLGDIPSMQTPTYAEMRNRICVDGSEWLTPTFKEIFSRKLNEQNSEYSFARKIMTEVIVKPVAITKKIRNIIKTNIND